jgi:HD-GYP domain-containing protein (c-di-GMP phosphodiesterase class II)
LARIAAVADVFDAILTDRPYRKGFPIEQCKQILLQDGVNGDLDLDLVKAMISILDGGLTAAAA